MPNTSILSTHVQKSLQITEVICHIENGVDSRMEQQVIYKVFVKKPRRFVFESPLDFALEI